VSEIVVVGSVKGRPGKEDETREVLSGLVAPTHAEAGCILYALNQGVEDKSRFASSNAGSPRSTSTPTSRATTSPH